MHIYKFTHIASGRCYIGQTIQDPNRRRRLAHLESTHCRGKTWKLINGKRVWLEASV